MKGIVFTELIEMVEAEHGFEVSDRMIRAAETANDGAYTSVGTYDHVELARLVASLSEITGTAVPDLVQAFGRYLFGRFYLLYPKFFEGVESAMEFLPRVETFIHVEVRKLYPDAELPSFKCRGCDGALEMLYESTRPFADLAEGLIRACVEHFDDDYEVTRTDLADADGTSARFLLIPQPSPLTSGVC